MQDYLLNFLVGQAQSRSKSVMNFSTTAVKSIKKAMHVDRVLQSMNIVQPTNTLEHSSKTKSTGSVSRFTIL